MTVFAAVTAPVNSAPTGSGWVKTDRYRIANLAPPVPGQWMPVSALLDTLLPCALLLDQR